MSKEPHQRKHSKHKSNSKSDERENKRDWKYAWNGLDSFIHSAWVWLLAFPVGLLVTPLLQKAVNFTSPIAVIIAAASGLTIAVWIVAIVCIISIHRQNKAEKLATGAPSISNAASEIQGNSNELGDALQRVTTEDLAYARKLRLQEQARLDEEKEKAEKKEKGRLAREVEKEKQEAAWREFDRIMADRAKSWRRRISEEQAEALTKDLAGIKDPDYVAFYVPRRASNYLNGGRIELEEAAELARQLSECFRAAGFVVEIKPSGEVELPGIHIDFPKEVPHYADAVEQITGALKRGISFTETTLHLNGAFSIYVGFNPVKLDYPPQPAGRRAN